MIKIKIGEFVKEHIEDIKKYCEKNLVELNNLQEKEYSKENIGLGSNYSFFILSKNADNDRYWNKEYSISNKSYRVCSQFGGGQIDSNNKTRSQREGEKFIEYLKSKSILGEKYKDKKIEFIVADNNKKQKIKEELEKNINYKTKNIILYGVPGVGKTYSHKKLIDLIENKKYNDSQIFENIEKHKENESFDKAKEENRVKFITFHQSFGYEDFIEGFRPNEDGNIKLQNGVFKELCEKAENDIEKNYYLVIDEINRGNISKIFGELITLIEEDKRDNLHVTLPYSKKEFSIPSNLYIIGTMNSMDKSIALIDIALRRRFTFIHMVVNPELVKYPKAKKLMMELNEKLADEYKIGHSYFMKIENDKDLIFTCKHKIKPLLEEYFYGDEDGLTNIVSFLPSDV